MSFRFWPTFYANNFPQNFYNFQVLIAEIERQKVSISKKVYFSTNFGRGILIIAIGQTSELCNLKHYLAIIECDTAKNSAFF